MTTILKEVSISSNTLMSNEMSEVCLKPSKDKGIRFHVNGGVIPAIVDCVASTQNFVVLAVSPEVKIGLVEHFMAALAICKIDSLDVFVSNFEMPILDGSAKKWVELINEAGIDKVENPEYTLCEPVYLENDKTTISVLPSDKFSITYCVDFQHPDLNNRWVSLTEDNLSEITEARTFGYLKDLEKIQAMGLAKGVSIENTVGLTDDGYTTELRSQYEPAKHKILDLLGDFHLTGINPLNMKVNVIAKNAGHSTHAQVAKILKDKLRENVLK